MNPDQTASKEAVRYGCTVKTVKALQLDIVTDSFQSGSSFVNHLCSLDEALSPFSMSVARQS